MKLKIFSAKDIGQSVGMVQAIGAVRRAYIQYSSGKAVLPPRIAVSREKGSDVTLFMPAYMTETKEFGIKIITIIPKNREKNIPTINAMILVLDAETGRAAAIMDGTYLTALRTGAGSGVATDLLARKDARVAAIFGAGIQARTQLEAICTVRSIRKVRVFDVSNSRAESFAEEMKRHGEPIPPDIIVASSPEEAVRDADIICAATTAFTPVFGDSGLKPGVHVNAIGSFRPEVQEIPAETVARAKVFVDSLPISLGETGDLIIPIQQGLIKESHIRGEIGQVATGRVLGRQSEEEITLFKSVGLAVQDVVVASLVLNHAISLGLGVEVEI